MAKYGKRTVAARKAFEGKTDLTVEEAVNLVKSSAAAKFDETVEIAVNLGVDPKHADQMVRGVINLPNGTGRTVRVAVFARDAKAAKGGEVQFRAEKAGVVQAAIGKVSFEEGALAENLRAFVSAVLGAKPTGSKGSYMKKNSS